MKDQYGREIDYLRISVTDRCNLRCRYCMPDGVGRKLTHDEILRAEEFVRIARCAARLGIRHIRITGGEPLARLGVPELIRKLKGIPGIETVTMTTNGMLLRENLDALAGAGIDGINISLDSPDPDIFRKITGSSGAGEVTAAIRETARRNIPVKINAVTMPLTDLPGMIAFAQDLPVDVRFIEMMPIGYGRLYPESDNRKLLCRLLEMYPDLEPESGAAGQFLSEAVGDTAGKPVFFYQNRHSPEKTTPPSSGRFHGQGPAVYFHIPGYQGSIGFISAVHGKFCASCNRVRLTSTGFLKTCLCYDQGTDLRRILRGGDTGGEDRSWKGTEKVTEDPSLQEGRLLQDDSPLRKDQKMAQNMPAGVSETGDGTDSELESAMRRAIFEKPRAHCFDHVTEITETHEMSQIGG